jgi:hypothetical protein
VRGSVAVPDAPELVVVDEDVELVPAGSLLCAVAGADADVEGALDPVVEGELV